MTIELKKSFCHYCGEEGYRRCSICGKQFCERHCKSYERDHSGLYYCHLSLKVCVHCEKMLPQLNPGDLLAKMEIDQINIRYA